MNPRDQPCLVAESSLSGRCVDQKDHVAGRATKTGSKDARSCKLTCVLSQIFGRRVGPCISATLNFRRSFSIHESTSAADIRH